MGFPLCSLANPFSVQTIVSFRLESAAQIECEVFNALGLAVQGDDRVRIMHACDNQLAIDLRDKPAGVYYVRLSANGEVTTLKVVRED